MTTYTFYGIVAPILKAGTWTNKGSAPTIKEEGPDNWETLENRGILLKNSSNITSLTVTSSLILRGLRGIIKMRDTTQLEIDKMEADIIDILEKGDISIAKIGITPIPMEHIFNTEISLEVSV